MSKYKTDPSNERIKSTQHYSLNQTKVSKRRRETKDVKAGPSQGSLFESSRNVKITEGQLNSVRGHQANLTITFNQHAENDRLEGDETEHLSDGRNSRGSPVMDNERDFSSIWNLPPLPVRRSCDIYYRHLAAKGRGSPMWEPEPSSTLPNVYRRRGITIGDVGIITASGGFDFMFNVCFPSDDPINQEGVPDSFLPILPNLRASDIRKRMVYNTNSYVASESVVKSHRGSESSEIEFESSASEGAILTMPQGAHTEDLANVSQFRQYFSSNAESWYTYINNIRGREAENGDVRLVIGCDKTSSWGMAAFSNSTAQDFRLKFKPTSERGSRRTYEWEYSAMVDARVGPDPEEMEELRSTDDSGNSPSVYKRLGLDYETTSSTNPSTLPNPTAPSSSNSTTTGGSTRSSGITSLPLKTLPRVLIGNYSHANSYGPGPSSSTNPPARSPNYAGLSSSNSTTAAGSARFLSSASLPWTTLPPFLIENVNTALTDHPSKTINDFILTENPHSRIAITSDDDWISLLIENDQQVPPPDELINRMLSSYYVCVADGTVFLQLKPQNQSTNTSFKQGDKEVTILPVSVFESDSLEPLRKADNDKGKGVVRQIQEQTAPVEEKEEILDKFDEEDRLMTAPDFITTGMSIMSLHEDRPAYSRVHRPLDLVRQESVLDPPEHVQRHFFMPSNPVVPTSGPHNVYAPASIPPQNKSRPPDASPSARHQPFFTPLNPAPPTSDPYAAYAQALVQPLHALAASSSGKRQYPPHSQGRLMAQGAYGGAPMTPPPWWNGNYNQ